MSESSTKDNKQSRNKLLKSWFQSVLAEFSPKADFNDFTINLVQGDASFRRYFRAQSSKESFILVDAPPEKENSQAFVDIAKAFNKHGVRVPELYQFDLKQGFLCLSDFGDTLLWPKLKEAQSLKADAGPFYREAFKELLLIQQVPVGNLPLFTEELLQQEMALFRHWFCEGLLNLSLTDQDSTVLNDAFDYLVQSATSQQQVCVHRDYHSRNLLYLEDKDPREKNFNSSIGVIDFQDAVKGPFTYDLVSLLKDCYIAWPENQVKIWALEYRDLAIKQKILDADDANIADDTFLKSFNLMGAQRHLKAIGIFSRLYLRDEKITYLTDIPRTLSYLRQVTAEYSELKQLHVWLEKKVMQDVEEKILETSAHNAITNNSINSKVSGDINRDVEF